MNRFLTFVCAVTLVFGFAGVALATTFTDTVWGPSYVGEFGSIDWQHDINDDDGFDPTVNILHSATLELFLADDWAPFRDPFDATNTLFEFATITTDGKFYDVGEVELFDGCTVSLTAWVQLQKTGLLDVTLTSKQGDFWFVSSTLVATNPNSIPDASAVFSLGSACLIGFAGVRRKLKR